MTIATGEDIPATGNHSWNAGEVTKEATCTEGGEETRVCTRDESHTETKPTPKNTDAHAWGEWKVTKEATCTEGGEETRVCTRDESHTETKPTPKNTTAHAWGELTTTKEATCLEEGLQEKQCSRCDTLDENETQTIELIGHDWGEWTTAKEATCTVDGEQERVCKNDSAHKETEVIKATGHQRLTEGVNKKDPTCEEPGYTGDTVCDDCGKTVTKGEEIPATGHAPRWLARRIPPRPSRATPATPCAIPAARCWRAAPRSPPPVPTTAMPPANCTWWCPAAPSASCGSPCVRAAVSALTPASRTTPP